MSDVVRVWMLNPEQERAFHIVAAHSLGKGEGSLRMFLTGPAGTGKSLVINALKDYFEKRNQMQRFQVCSYMGIAAYNVSGMTLHAALGVGKHTKSRMTQAASCDLVTGWEEVDYLFLDEVSMISCCFLCMISEHLSLAKGDTGSFGGVNMIFADDFMQLPPVAEMRLYAKINTHSIAGTVQGQ